MAKGKLFIATAAVITAVAVGGCASRGSSHRAQDATAPRRSSFVVLNRDLSPAEEKLPLAGLGLDIVYDKSRKDLWVLEQDGSDPQLSLLKFAPDTGVVTKIKLPSEFKTSLFDHVRIAPDGAVWVSGGYSLGRVDPTTNNLATTTFDEPGTPGSLTDDTKDTAVSSFAPEANGDVVVSRDNIPYLTEITTKMVVSRQIDVESQFSGAADLVISSAGLIALGLDGNLTEPSSQLPLSTSPPGADQDILRLPRDMAGPQAEFLARGVDGARVDDNSLTGTLSWQADAKTDPTQVSLPSSSGTVGKPNGSGETTVTLRPTITAATVDSDGDLWFAADWNTTRQVYELPAS